MIELAENRYGKSRVRLMKVTRHAHGNDLREWSVQVLLKGDFDSAHLEGDNSKILPTDTMKNTVYSIARSSSATTMEGYGRELVDFLLGRNPQVSSAAVTIESVLWKRLTVDGDPHPDTFMRGSSEVQTTRVERAQNGAFEIHSGLEHLVILKTAKSGFAGYIKDSLTTLKETNDRLFGTALRAEWRYNTQALDYDAVRCGIRETMLATFAEHDSKSVQQTLFAMAQAALEAVPQIDEIELTMPNKHCLLVDLSPFGQDNPNEIFVPTDEPHGTIEARVRRRPTA
ncbi:factor-independent urate hydroxylase [Edaphobacter bradus]|uniref:factor-independent urate hydroxylase n=1 Tax=Edaphobacter bradus TaxID=2259016 RepID=UPI0021DF8E6A|nr:urate oxidase [Edaphobacter bradus]